MESWIERDRAEASLVSFLRIESTKGVPWRSISRSHERGRGFINTVNCPRPRLRKI